MFQIGFFEILLILSLGLVIIGPKQLPVVIKFIIKQYKKLQQNLDIHQTILPRKKSFVTIQMKVLTKTTAAISLGQK